MEEQLTGNYKTQALHITFKFLARIILFFFFVFSFCSGDAKDGRILMVFPEVHDSYPLMANVLTVLAKASGLKSLKISQKDTVFQVDGKMNELKHFEKEITGSYKSIIVKPIALANLLKLTDLIDNTLNPYQDVQIDSKLATKIFGGEQAQHPMIAEMLIFETERSAMYIKAEYLPLLDSVLNDSSFQIAAQDIGLSKIGLFTTETIEHNDMKVVEAVFSENEDLPLKDTIESISFDTARIMRMLFIRPQFADVFPKYTGISEDTLAQHIISTKGRAAFDSLFAIYNARSDSMSRDVNTLLTSHFPIPILHLSNRLDEDQRVILLRRRGIRISFICGGFDELYRKTDSNLPTWDSKIENSSVALHSAQGHFCGRPLYRDNCIVFYLGDAFGYGMKERAAESEYKELATEICLGLLPEKIDLTYEVKQ